MSQNASKNEKLRCSKFQRRAPKHWSDEDEIYGLFELNHLRLAIVTEGQDYDFDSQESWWGSEDGDENHDDDDVDALDEPETEETDANENVKLQEHILTHFPADPKRCATCRACKKYKARNLPLRSDI